jgi:AAA domain
VNRGDIIATHPLADFIRARGHRLVPAGENFVTNGCPVTQHTKRGHRPVTIDTPKQVWCCNDCDKGGSVIDWLMCEKGISAAQAMRELSGGPAPTSIPKKKPSPVPFNWQKCNAVFTEEDVLRIAKWRGFSPSFVRELRETGLIGIYNDRGVRRDAFPVYNQDKIVGAHHRVPQQNSRDVWRYTPTGINAEPWVIGKLVPGENVIVTESTWDGLDWMDKSGERDAIIIARGKSNGKQAAALIPAGSIAYVLTQNDKAGAEFETDLAQNTREAVRRIRTPVPHKDLNDWTRAGATTADLIAAMADAEIVREAEFSWYDALTRSALTSKQLQALDLPPRKKLLGDWFAEGDLGIIFAFRGVGKTWFGMALAEALSGGRKFGDWQAPSSVGVLYIDSEMPADLMENRSTGLQTNDKFAILNHEALFHLTGKTLNIADPEVQAAITRHCLETKRKVLVIDNLSTAFFGMKENEADSWEKVLPWLLTMRRHRIAVILIHHAGRSGEMRGTTKREDSVFWIIALDDMKTHATDRRGAHFMSRFTKPSRNTQEDLPAYEWRFLTEHNGLVTISFKIAHSLQVFLRTIADGVTDCAQIASEMKVSPATVSRMAKKALDKDWIRKKGRNYELTTAGELFIKGDESSPEL